MISKEERIKRERILTKLKKMSCNIEIDDQFTIQDEFIQLSQTIGHKSNWPQFKDNKNKKIYGFIITHTNNNQYITFEPQGFFCRKKIKINNYPFIIASSKKTIVNYDVWFPIIKEYFFRFKNILHQTKNNYS